MEKTLYSLTHGSDALALAYATVLVPLLASLARARAGAKQFLLSPVVAAVALLFVSLVLALCSSLLRPLGLLGQFVLGELAGVAAGWYAGLWLAARASGAVQHRRGAVVTGPGASVRTGGGIGTASLRPQGSGITLAGVPVPPQDETKHFKIIGTTGTGKSTAIHELLAAALTRGDRAIIADPDGGYRRRFFNAARGDVVLNPFDPQACRWDLFGELRTDYDVDQLARSLIPDTGDDHTWTQYARTFFTAVVQQHLDQRNAAELYASFTKASLPELRLMLSNTIAGPFLEEGNEKMFGSIRSTAASALRALSYTTKQQGTALSVRQWVRRGPQEGGVLFLPYSAGEIAALGSIISAWMRLGIFEAMDQPEADQRLWFIVDELDALGAIDGLKDALARLRKFGGRCVLGFQSISQVSRTYGKGVAATMVENCGNTLILRCSASEAGGTSEFASRLIGQREVLITNRSRTHQPLSLLASTTDSEALRVEAAIMASEIERLPDLAGFLKVASRPDWHTVTLVHPDRDAVQDIRGPAQ